MRKNRKTNCKARTGVADESRYFCMSRPIRPVRKGEDLLPADDPLNMRTGG